MILSMTNGSRDEVVAILMKPQYSESVELELSTVTEIASCIKKRLLPITSRSEDPVKTARLTRIPIQTVQLRCEDLPR